MATYNYTQRYMLVSDLFRCFLWIAVNARFLLLFPLTGIRFLPGGIADFFLGVNVATVLFDLLDYVAIFSKVSTRAGIALPKPANLVLTLLERTIITGCILCYPKIAKSPAFATLVYTESLVELIRYYYNFYKVRTFGANHKVLRLIKKVSYTVVVPVQVCSELLLLFNSLQTESYYPELAQYDSRVKLGIRFILIMFLPAFYMLFRRKLYEYYYLAWQNRAASHQKKD